MLGKNILPAEGFISAEIRTSLMCWKDRKISSIATGEWSVIEETMAQLNQVLHSKHSKNNMLILATQYLTLLHMQRVFPSYEPWWEEKLTLCTLETESYPVSIEAMKES